MLFTELLVASWSLLALGWRLPGQSLDHGDDGGDCDDVHVPRGRPMLICVNQQRGDDDDDDDDGDGGCEL